jgi:flagellar hook-associated protein 2
MGISFNAASLLNGNGIDVNAVVSELQAASSGQLTTWQQDQTDLQTQQGLLTSINTDLNSLATAVNALADPAGALTSVSATSSQPVILTATAENSAAAGNYNVVVSTLATTGTLYTASVASAKTSILPSGATSGDLQLQIGGSGGTTADVAITAGSNDTLTTLASSINSQSATNNWGITASVVTDASGARLAIYSQSTGSSGTLATTTNTTALAFEPPVGGTNADITVNGIPYSSTTNAVTGAIPGVTLNLLSAFAGTQVQVAVGADTTQVSSAIDSFVSAYNTVLGDINNQYTVNATTNAEGPLGSDPSLRLLQSNLLADASYAISSNSSLTNLASLGINTNDDGTLAVDNTQLSGVLSSNPAAVQSFFQNATSTGFANNFSSDLNNLTDATQGILTVDIAQNQAEQTDIANHISDFQDQLATQKTQLELEFSQVNATLESYPFLLQEVTAQLTNGSSSGSTSTNTTPTSGTATG